MKRISILVVTLLAFATVWGQSKVSPFTAHYMRGQQVQTRAQSVPDKVVSAYLHTVGTPDVSALEALGIKVNLQLDGILTVRLPLSAVPALEQLDFIKYIEMGTPVRQMLDKALPAAGVDKVHAAEGLDMAYTGKGVVVGIIDGGFDYTHPAYCDAAGKLRIKRVWEQGTTTSAGTVPAGFGYGIELTTEEAILAAGADVTTQSHGGHVAAIAAGSASVEGNPYCGVAPDADLVLVSKGAITANSANISDAIAYIYNYADSVGKPCVVNMSLGWHQGPHDGTSAFDRVADQLQGPGRVLVGSMGNYGNDKIHVSKTFAGKESSPLQTMISYKITPSMSEVGGEVDIWGDSGMEFGFQMVIVKKSTGEVAEASEMLTISKDVAGTTKEFSFSSRYSVGSIMVTTEVNPLNGKPHAFVTLSLTSLRGAQYAVGIIVTPHTAGTVHAWTDAVYTTFSDEVKEGWTAGDKQYTLCEIGGTGNKIISVGAYVSSNTYTELGSSQPKLTDEKLGTLATFSSVGPTTDGRMKPDVIAPGTFIASAVNSYDSYKSAYPTASVVAWNGKTYNYSYMQGTSMAAPFVTGVVATWLQAHPTLDSDAIRQVLKKTAINDEYTTPATCGYGKIDAYAGLKEVLALAAGIEGTEADATAASFVVRHVGNALLLSFARPLGQTEIRLYDASGIRLQSHTLDVSEAGHTFTLPMQDLPHGLYLLHVGHETVKVVR